MKTPEEIKMEHLNIETWLKSRYSEQLVHANSAFLSSIIYDYCSELEITKIKK